CCIVAYLNYEFNVNFDKNESPDIYRLESEKIHNGKNQRFGISPLPLAAILDENFEEVTAVSRYISEYSNFRVDDEYFSEGVKMVDPAFFDLFSFEILEGSKSDLKDKASIFISKKLAEKHFADQNPLGKQITHLSETGPKDYKIVGIFKDPPLNSSFGGSYFITNISNWIDLQNANQTRSGISSDWGQMVLTFFKLQNKSDKDKIESVLTSEYLEPQNKARVDHKIQSYQIAPFAGLGLKASKGKILSHSLRRAAPPPAVIVPAIMALLILLIACFNFTNTSVAIAGKRLKEIGLRKVMGGLRSQLCFQFFLENTLLCAAALVVSLAIASYLVPAYSQMWPFLELSLSFDENISFYSFLVFILLLTAVLAGIYPAFYITKYEPAAIIKGSNKYGSTGKITYILLTLQFSISLMSIVLGMVFYKNSIFQKEMSYGYESEGVISLQFDTAEEFNSFKNTVSSYTKIKTLAGSVHHVDRGYINDPVENGLVSHDVDIMHIGDNYMEAVNFRLLQGRKFLDYSETDQRESVIVSEELVRRFGWGDPIGKKIVWRDTIPLYVVGVIEDVYLRGFWDPVSALMLRYAPEEAYKYMTVKSSADDLQGVDKYFKQEWSKLFPDKMYTGEYLDNGLDNASLINKNIISLFLFLAFIATLMSALGLFSLVSLSIMKQTKQIGIRKVLGASIRHLLFLLSGKFVVILVIASIFGCVISYYAANLLLSSIWEYHIVPGVFSFVSSITLLLIVALGTVGLKVYNAAVSNPTEIIRVE
ncbi:ABC transporter permease, partial [Fulvivirga sp. RKSG066]|uniref:ABC transporter permease n=1 Tax=Fulvivirga aurantia TaxID=2529383 RepID=UPI0012BD1EEA